jgi:hypothetical protein
MSLIHPHNLTLLRQYFPQVDQGAADVTAGIWRDVEGFSESLAYEVGRMLVTDPPGRTSLGLLVMSPYLERAFKLLVAC